MRSRLLAVIAAAVLAAGGLLAVSAGPASAHCGSHVHPDLYSGGRISFADGTRIRSGPGSSCSVRGLGYSNHGIDVHCLQHAVWYYVRDTSTGVNGWAHRDALRFNMAPRVPFCG